MKFKLTEKQTQFVGAFEQFPAYIAAIGTGKSTALIIKALFHSQESPGNLGVIVRKNFTDLRDSTIRDFETYTGFKVSEQKKECTLPNGSAILFRHGDELPVLKNLNLGFFGIEQAEEFPDSTPWEFLKMRLRRQVKFRSGFLVGNTNGHNWIYDIWKKNGSPANHSLIEARTEDHKEFLPADYLKNLETLPRALYNRYVLNSWDEAEGLVYSEYRDNEHVIEPYEIPESWERGFVLDHGFRNPTAVLWYAIDYDGNVILYDEHYEAEKPVSYHAECIKRRGLTSGLSDPSIFNKTQSIGSFVLSIADEYREHGINLSPSIRETEYAAIARVNEFFKAGWIKIFKTLINTRQEFGNWKWKPKRIGANVTNMPEEPEDYANHQADNLKYLIQSRFPSSTKPEPRGEKDSLAYYERHVEMLNHRREAVRSIW